MNGTPSLTASDPELLPQFVKAAHHHVSFQSSVPHLSSLNGYIESESVTFDRRLDRLTALLE